MSFLPAGRKLNGHLHVAVGTHVARLDQVLSIVGKLIEEPVGVVGVSAVFETIRLHYVTRNRYLQFCLYFYLLSATSQEGLLEKNNTTTAVMSLR